MTGLPPIRLSAFERSPDGGKGLARDTRVRWALEEVGQPYDMRLLSFAALKQPDHLARHPFGQIPTLEQGDVVLFESGAIILHIASTWPGLLPMGDAARGRAVSWLFAALNTVEPPILELANARLFERDAPWADQRLPILHARIDQRLTELAAHLGDGAWLDGDFSVGDLMMVSVLQRLKATGLLNHHPIIAAYVGRGEARPAYARAFAAQLAINAG